MPEANDTPRTWKSVLLGAVVVCQFAAVLIVNVAGYFVPTPDSTTGILTAMPAGPMTALRFTADRYTEVTGQFQGWGMFEHGYMWNSVELKTVITLHSDCEYIHHGTVWLDDINKNLYSFPSIHNRRFVFESAMLGNDLVCDSLKNSDGAFLSNNINVRINNVIYERYLLSVYHRCKREKPLIPGYVWAYSWDELPVEMKLIVEGVRTVAPQYGIEPGFGKYPRQYVARWKPGDCSANTLPIEAAGMSNNEYYNVWIRLPKESGK